MNDLSRAILLVSCPDKPGIVAQLASTVHEMGWNIVQVDQSVDAEHGDFRMRMVLEGPSAFTRCSDFGKKITKISVQDDIAMKLRSS